MADAPGGDRRRPGLGRPGGLRSTARPADRSQGLPDRIELTIEKPAAGGRMIARMDGRVVLVAGAIPGERVLARVERMARGVVYAATERVIDADPARRDVETGGPCGGNVYAHIAYPRQLELKSELIADTLRRIGRIRLHMPARVAPSREDGYRMRARLHVAEGRIGFFRDGTHSLCDPAPTKQLRDDTLGAISALASSMGRDALDAVSSIEVAENLPADERAVHLHLKPGTRLVDDAVAAARQSGGLTGVSCADPTGRQADQLAGTPWVADAIEALLAVPDGHARGGRIRRHVRSFFQANRYIVRELVADVLARIGDGPVVDLYAGVGLFALAAAATGRGPIVAVEGDRVTGTDLVDNARSYEGLLRVRRLPVERYLTERAPAGALCFVLDPPRTGLSADVVGALAGKAPERILYVSCDLATFARDLRRFADAAYEMSELLAYDMFPNTAHVEALALLVRGGAPAGGAA